MSLKANTVSDIRRTYLEQCGAMIAYSIESGIKLDELVISSLDSSFTGGEEEELSLKTLAQIHNYLVDAIHPMTPQSIQIRHQERFGRTWLSRLTLIRKLMYFAIACLLSLVLISLSSQVNGDPKNFNLFANSGMSLLLNELFLVTSAGLGASFSALFRANRFVERGTYDPSYETSYWLHVILGIVAGTILGMLVPIEEIEKLVEGTNETHVSSLNGLGKPLLAIAGGFSAQLVYKALLKIVKFLESLLDTLIPNAYVPKPKAKVRDRDIVKAPLSLVTDLIAQPTQNPSEPQPSPTGQNYTQIGRKSSQDQFVRDLISLGEGCRDTVYQDSLGIPTIGIGCNLQEKANQELIKSMGIDCDALIRGDLSLTDTQINEVFSVQLKQCEEKIVDLFSSFESLSPLRQAILIDMIFNLGPGRLAKFKKFRQAVESHDFKAAAKEMKNSRWFYQVGQRGQRDVYIMEHDTLQGAPFTEGLSYGEDIRQVV